MGIFGRLFGKGRHQPGPRYVTGLGGWSGTGGSELSEDDVESFLRGEATTVRSSWVGNLAQYHPGNRSLMLETHDKHGRVTHAYVWDDVSPEEAEGFIRADSKGVYVNAHFKGKKKGGAKLF